MIFAPPTRGPVWLASRSPRRRSMLDGFGIEVRTPPSALDDAGLRRGCVSPDAWVMALAYLKARWATEHLPGAVGTVLAADTVCVDDGRVLGQPCTAQEAAAMIRALRDHVHVTMTGVCLIDLADGRRWLLMDRAVVEIGAVDDEQVDRYVESGSWRGKAGGYNLEERVAAGWPITCEGDPCTVMGLPMRRLEAWLTAVREAAR